MDSSRRRPTIKQVAAMAGVSTQTISRVLNNRPDVADETRERVKVVMEKLGYQPSALARSLIQNRSYTLGVVSAGLKYIGPSRTLNGIACAAEQAGYSLILKELPRFTADNITPIFNEFNSRHVDGIIWSAPEIGNNREWVDNSSYNIPVPIVYLTMESRPGKSIIAVDNYTGAKIATEHLLKNGYHHIGHIAGPVDWWEARKRFSGWMDAMMAAGYKDIECRWAEGNWSPASGAEATIKLFEQYPEMDAIFSANDQMALGVLKVIHDRGLRVPEDFGIVGFDNIQESEYFWPPLTTIQHDQNLAGIVAVKEIIRIIEANQSHTDPDFQNIVLQPEIVLRKSSLRK